MSHRTPHAAVGVAISLLVTSPTLAQAIPTAASRSVDADVSWRDRFDPSGAQGSASQSVGPVTTFGIFDEAADALAQDINAGPAFAQLISAQTSNIAPTSIDADLSITSDFFSPGLSVNTSYDASNFFSAEFDLASPTDAVFDASIEKGFLASGIFAEIQFYRVGGGFGFFQQNINAIPPLSFDGTLPAGSYVINLRMTYEDPGFDTFYAIDNGLTFDLALAPSPSTAAPALLLTAASLRRRRR